MTYQHSKFTQQGVRWVFTDPIHAPLTSLNFHFLDAIQKLFRHNLMDEATQAGRNFSMFDKVMGTNAIRLDLQRGRSALSIVASWKADEDAFRKKRQKYLLY